MSLNLKKVNWGHYANYIVFGILTAVLGGMSLTGTRFDSSLLYLLEKIAISVILAVSLSLVVGFLGELSLGHAGFMCVGAYLSGKVASMLVPTMGNSILTFLIALVVGAAAAALWHTGKGGKDVSLQFLCRGGVLQVQKDDRGLWLLGDCGVVFRGKF